MSACLQKAVIILLLSICCPLALADQSVALEIEEAVQSARGGQLTESIQRLEALRAQYPNEPLIVYDLIVLHSWANNVQAGVALLQQFDPFNAPAYSLEAAARLLRAHQDYPRAIAFYQQLQRRAPDNKQALLGLALTHTEAKDYAAAKEPLDLLQARFGADTEVQLALAYWERLSGHAFKALSRYQKILEDAPDSQEALSGVYQCAATLGAFAALKPMLASQPEFISDQQKGSVLQGLAAINMRWGARQELDIEKRYEDVDRSLAYLEQALEHPLSQPSPVENVREPGLLADALVALHTRKRIAELIRLYERMQEQGISVPDYALRSVAAAYLEQEEPEMALALFSDIKRRGDHSFALDHGLFYSLSDTEGYEEAQSLMDAIAAREPEFIPEFTGHELLPNEKKLQADMLAAFIRAYADDLASAQTRVERIVHFAPHNDDLRVDLATLYRWRGWLDRAQKELALSLDYLEPEDSANARIQLAQILIDRQDSVAARPLVDSLSVQYPEEKSVQRLTRRWHAYEDAELLSRWHWGESSGNQFGTETWQLDTYLYADRQASGARFYLHDFQAFAELADKDVRNQLVTLGYEWLAQDLRLNVELGKGVSGSREPVANFALAWRLDDYWQLAMEAQRNSRSTPLKAINLDLEANSMSLNLTHRWHEMRSAGMGVQLMDFEDGNDRHNASGFYKQRIWNSARYKLTAEAGASLSGNSARNRPYFNPEKDRTFYVQLEYEWRIYRRYDKSLHHRLYLTVGDYWQKDFGAGNIWTWRYEQDWEWAPRLRVLCGIARGRRLYDGSAEFENQIYGLVNWRF